MMEQDVLFKKLIANLHNKVTVLDELILKTMQQKELISNAEDLDETDFQNNLAEKDQLVYRMNQLEDEFMILYDQVKDSFEIYKSHYSSEIIQMKKLISDITSKSMKIQAEEKRNKILIEKHFARMKNKVKQVKTSNRVAAGYYKSMVNAGIDDSRYMDKKK